MSASAIAELRAAFEEPFWALGRDAATRSRNGRHLVAVRSRRARSRGGILAGLRSRRAARRRRPRTRARARPFPEPAPAARRGRADRALARRCRIVLPRTSDPDYKCFLYLRELVAPRHRAAPAADLAVRSAAFGRPRRARRTTPTDARDWSRGSRRLRAATVESDDLRDADRERQSRARRGAASAARCARIRRASPAPTHCRCSARSGSSSPSVTPRSPMRRGRRDRPTSAARRAARARSPARPSMRRRCTQRSKPRAPSSSRS